ncbi:PqqD family protein [bacterium]|nr:PqqD family protein [bacterium]
MSFSLQIEGSPPLPGGSPNLLDVVPKAGVCSTIGPDGLVTLHVPKFRSRTLQGILVKCRISPCVRIRLDEFGSCFWKLADGSRDVGEIGRELQTRFGESVQPVYERLAVFLRQMKANRCIALKEKRPTDRG